MGWSGSVPLTVGSDSAIASAERISSAASSAELLQDRNREALGLFEQGGEQVRGRDLRIAGGGGHPLRGGEGLLGLDREAVLLHEGRIRGLSLLSQEI